MAEKQPKIVNPLTGKKLRKEAADYVRQCRQARNAARRDARSGNPARRASAAPVLRAAPKLIRTIYRQETNQ